MIKRVFVVFLIFLLVGCSGSNKEKNLDITFNNDVLITKGDYSYILDLETVSFINQITVIESKEKLGNPIAVVHLNQDLVFYDNLMLSYQNKNYQILKKPEDYVWDVLTSNVFNLKDYVDTISHIEICSYGVPQYKICISDLAIDQVLEEVSNYSIQEYGVVERGAGGYEFRLVCGNTIIEDGNGARIFVDGVEITNKQSIWLSDSLGELVYSLVDIQDDQVLPLVNTVSVIKLDE